MNEPVSSVFIFAFLAAIWILIFALSVFSLVCTYKLYKKANHKYPWLAFLIFPAFVPFFHVINRSAWNVLWMLVPYLTMITGSILMENDQNYRLGLILFLVSLVPYFVFAIKFTIEFLDVYGIDRPWILAILLIPLAQYVILGYMAFSRNVQYKGTLYQKQ